MIKMYRITLECGHTMMKFTGQREHSIINNNTSKYDKRNMYTKCEHCGRQTIIKSEHVVL